MPQCCGHGLDVATVPVTTSNYDLSRSPAAVQMQRWSREPLRSSHLCNSKIGFSCLLSPAVCLPPLCLPLRPSSCGRWGFLFWSDVLWPFFFFNTFVHDRWFSVYSSCGAEQMDTGWHLKITPRNNDLLQSPCPSFFFFLLRPQAAECVGSRPTAVPLYTDPPFPAKPLRLIACPVQKRGKTKMEKWIVLHLNELLGANDQFKP